MTTVIGMIYSEGIMILGDTQETVEGNSSILATKLDFQKKVHPINSNYVLGCASKSSNTIDEFVNQVHMKFDGIAQPLSRQELYRKLNDELVPSFCIRDRQLAENIYGKPLVRPIELEAIFGAKLDSGEFALFKISIFITGNDIRHDDVGVKEIPFGAIGTGGTVVEPLMNQTLMLINKKGYNFRKWTKKLAGLFLSVLLGIARDTDSRTGKHSSGVILTSNEMRYLQWTEYVTPGTNILIQLAVQGLAEMPKFVEMLPLDKLIELLPSEDQ